MAGVRFTVDIKKFARDMSRVGQRMAQGAPRAAHTLAVQMAKDTEQYVPAMTKSMANRVHPEQKRLTDRTEIDGDTIIYPGPYAHYLYVGKLFIDPDTGSSWAAPGANKVITGKDLNISTAVHSKAQAHWFEASKAQNLPKWRNVAGRAMQREFRR